MIRPAAPEKHTMTAGEMVLDVPHSLWVDPDNRTFLKNWWHEATASLPKKGPAG